MKLRYVEPSRPGGLGHGLRAFGGENPDLQYCFWQRFDDLAGAFRRHRSRTAPNENQADRIRPGPCRVDGILGTGNAANLAQLRLANFRHWLQRSSDHRVAQRLCLESGAAQLRTDLAR